MDNKFRIPGTNFRFGLDALIGLVPYAGDIVSFSISGLLLLMMAQKGASRMLLIKLIFNLLLDSIVGSIPILGDIFDMTYKANVRNLKLMEEYTDLGQHRGSGKGVIFILILSLILMFVFLVWLVLFIIKGSWSLLGLLLSS